MKTIIALLLGVTSSAFSATEITCTSLRTAVRGNSNPQQVVEVATIESNKQISFKIFVDGKETMSLKGPVVYSKSVAGGKVFFVDFPKDFRRLKIYSGPRDSALLLGTKSEPFDGAIIHLQEVVEKKLLNCSKK